MKDKIEGRHDLHVAVGKEGASPGNQGEEGARRLHWYWEGAILRHLHRARTSH